jgi:hypothetical protein
VISAVTATMIGMILGGGGIALLHLPCLDCQQSLAACNHNAVSANRKAQPSTVTN